VTILRNVFVTDLAVSPLNDNGSRLCKNSSRERENNKTKVHHALGQLRELFYRLIHSGKRGKGGRGLNALNRIKLEFLSCMEP
jgi:hypothetical protein